MAYYAERIKVGGGQGEENHNRISRVQSTLHLLEQSCEVVQYNCPHLQVQKGDQENLPKASWHAGDSSKFLSRQFTAHLLPLKSTSALLHLSFKRSKWFSGSLEIPRLAADSFPSHSDAPRNHNIDLSEVPCHA